jgi:hypothetical protein
VVKLSNNSTSQEANTTVSVLGSHRIAALVCSWSERGERLKILVSAVRFRPWPHPNQLKSNNFHSLRFRLSSIFSPASLDFVERLRGVVGVVEPGQFDRPSFSMPSSAIRVARINALYFVSTHLHRRRSRDLARSKLLAGNHAESYQERRPLCMR